MSDRLTLSDVLGRGISVEWPEGVAVVRGVAAHLLGNPGQTNLVPDLHQIEISRTGRISIIGGTSADEPLRRLGQMLQATLVHSEPPVQLRLIISQATAPTPGFSSIREYDEALGYFERPNRDAVLQTLYARAAAAPSISGSESKPKLDAIAPLPTADLPKTAQSSTAAKRNRTLRLAGSAVVVLLLCVGAVQYAMVTGVTPGTRDVSAITLHASEMVGAAVVSGLSAVTERVGLGRLVAAEAIGGEPQPASAGPPVQTSGVDRAAPVRGNPRMAAFAAFDLEPVPAALVPAAEASRSLSSESVLPEELSTTEGRVQTEGELVLDEHLVVLVDEPTIYSPGSEGVSPPVSVRPQLPRELPANINSNDLVRIELVVLADGTVDTVRLLVAPHSVHDSMLLSAIKSWQFQPALMDGVPVRYRKTVWIAPQ